LEVVLFVNEWKQIVRSSAALAVILSVLIAGGVLAQDNALPPGDRPTSDVFSRLEAAGNASDFDHADYAVVYDYAVNTVKPSGVTYVDSYIIYKILTPAGCRDRSVLRWNYDPQSSYVELREVNVIRGGEKIPVDISDVHDLPAPQAWIYWKDRIKTLQLPRLQVDDGIEVKVFRKGFTYALLNQSGSTTSPDDDRYIPPMPGEYFDIVLFAGPAPIVEKKYTLILPPDKILHSEVYNGPLYSSTTYTEEKNEYSWWGIDLAPRVREPRQPDASDFVPKVVIATVESWEAKSRWFFDVNREQFEVTAEIKEKVEEIFEKAGLTNASEEKKAEILVHWVAQNIRYSGQTMGEGEGFTLHPGPMIFEQRSGVCKDIAGMLITMMRAAGMNSFAAMTMAGSRIDEVPADQFNHCVCALRKNDGTFEMYDPTWVPYNNSIWSLLEAEQHYLVGTPEGEPLSRIAYSPPEESPLRVTHDAELTNEGTLKGRFKLEGSGALDGRLRRLVNGVRKTEMRNRIAHLLSPVGNGVEQVVYQHPAPDDFSQDMWITFDYVIPGFTRTVAGGFEFTSPMMNVVLNDGMLFRAGSVDWSDERTTDVFLYYTQLVDGTETIKLPRGYAVNDPPASEVVDETYACFKGTSSMKGRTLTIEQHAEVRRRQIPTDGYEGFKRAMDEAKEWGEKSFRAEKGGK
jgi:hypothetical protein